MAPGVLLGKLEGHFSEDLVPHYLAAMDETDRAKLPMVGFHDWETMESYDSICRRRLTEWVLAHRRSQNLLFKSRLVAMGVATAALIIGGDVLISHRTRASFEQALKAAIAKRV